jgi:hypothetical protein
MMQEITEVLPIALKEKAQAVSAYKSSKNGEAEEKVLLAIQDVPVKKSSETELKEALRYAMLLVGVRAANLPVDIEKNVLITHIRQYFGMYTIAEIRLAFELAIVGELNLKPEDVKCYENFSPQYVSMILKAYGKYSSPVIDFNERRYKPAKAALPPAEYSPVDLVNVFYHDFLKGEYNPKLVSEIVYDTAFKKCGLRLTEGEMLTAIEMAKEHVVNEYAVRLPLMVSSREDVRSRELREKKIALEKMPVGKACENDDVNHYAKALCLQMWFQAQKSKGVQKIINFL